LGLTDDYQARATAVAYVGFPSKINEGDLDAPIAICVDKIQVAGATDQYTCNVGQFSPSSDVQGTGETTSWSNLTRCDYVGDGVLPDDGDSVDTGDVRTLVDAMQCPSTGDGVNSRDFSFGDGLTISNGELNPATADLYADWLACNGIDLEDEAGTSVDDCPDTPWVVRMPVIDCDAGETGCRPIQGAVAVQLLWVNDDVTAQNLPCSLSWKSSPKPTAPVPLRMTGVSSVLPGGALTTINWDVDYPDGGVEDIDNDGVDDTFVSAKNRFGDNVTTCDVCPCTEDDIRKAYPETSDPETKDDLTIDEWPDSVPRPVPAYSEAGAEVYAAGQYCRHKQIWDSFVETFNIRTTDGNGPLAYWSDSPPNPYKNNTYYFAPYCEVTELGGTGGNNFGVLSEVPVLVF
jgi:hypothetical protein